MKRVKGVKDLNVCIIGAQGIVGVGAAEVGSRPPLDLAHADQ